MTTLDALLPAVVLQRKAVVYVRQSTPQQVQLNLESQRRQYELVEVARRRGFTDIEVIDDDLGRTARISSPIGYAWDRNVGLGLDPDRRLQEVIRLVFQKFREPGSARQVLLWMASHPRLDFQVAAIQVPRGLVADLFHRRTSAAPTHMTIDQGAGKGRHHTSKALKSASARHPQGAHEPAWSDGLHPRRGIHHSCADRCMVSLRR